MAWQGYKIVGKLGEGGMATVYKAIQESLQRPVAIKIMAANLKDHPEIKERFDKESLIIARLAHPHIIHVIDKGMTGKGRPYFVMEYVEGMSLEDAINRGKLDFAAKIDTMVQVCKALAYAHKNGVIHRDIKPGNILIDKEWQVRMADFGIAHFYNPEAGDTLHTEAESVVGTSAYMAPEIRVNPEAASVESDVYALGITMYELFTGVCPQNNIPPPRKFEPDIPPGLNDLIMRCLDPDPAERPSSANEVKNTLLHLSQGGHLSRAQKERAASNSKGLESQFSLLDVLKENKYCSVYLYEDLAKKKLMVVKKLPVDAQGLKENKLLSRLTHPTIVPILGLSYNTEGVTLISEYLNGGSLAEQMLSPVDELAMMEWAYQIADGLAFAHRNRIFHGNLRPSNVLFDSERQVKLADFGLKTHYLDSEEPNWYEDPKAQGASRDLYSLGAICYHALSGNPPTFRSNRLVRSKRFTELSPRVQEVVSRLLDPQEDKRYPNGDIVVADLKGIVKKLKEEQAEQQTRELRRKVNKAAAEVRKQERPPIRWKAWIFRILVLALIAEEVVYGYGYHYLKPHVLLYVEKLKGTDAYIEWSGQGKDGKLNW
ncbi:serine/threonine protein kinase [Hahella sp. CCB-MM4]|uniref:protein kinase domain-containing protein n=1 Tax=Hahella sp. (strain CCB-MM4) TaxID=1926491 RepID=UPI000B9C3BC2|nr:protein kinase [Hahella sp. CCB-MM4]OZG75366.1 serine/threonine protein kinase [Hahella sp. CCB-MM4]